MKVLIIYVSVHHKNTEKIAKAMAEAVKAKIVRPDEVTDELISQYDLIGFGSGIYMWKHHQKLLELADRLSSIKGKKAFIFSTSGANRNQHDKLREKLINKGFNIVGEFTCPGWDTVIPLFTLFGGINKGRPNETDINKAKEFIKELTKRKKS
jgi:flavodoxin